FAVLCAIACRVVCVVLFFFSSRRRHTRSKRDWSSDVCSSDLVGTHPGAQAFTIGQRRGLGIGKPAGDGKPRFVLEIRPKDNTVLLCSINMIAVNRLTCVLHTLSGSPSSCVLS